MKMPTFAILLLFVFGLSSVLAGQWLTDRKEIVTIVSVDRMNGFATAKIGGGTTPICLWEAKVSIQRKGGGIRRGSLDDLKPGVRIRAHGGHSSSPLSFIARKIIIDQ